MSLLARLDAVAWWCAEPLAWSLFDMREAWDNWDVRDMLWPLWGVPMLIGLLWLVARRWPAAPVNEPGRRSA